MRLRTNIDQHVDEILELTLEGAKRALSSNLIGVYLRGSLATGDFVRGTSDIDLLVITEHRVEKAEFSALFSFHKRLAELPNPYAKHLEIAYVDRQSMWHFEPGIQHPTLYRGEQLTWAEHRENWILERWVVREHGQALIGPEPKTLIAPISPDDLRTAVQVRLQDWVKWANQADDPDWALPLGHKRYVVETMCRALYTLAFEELPSKHQAIEWAIENFPEPYRSTVEGSRTWKSDGLPDPATKLEIRNFVNWAASTRKF
jgi:predicted nucleotidyltransferase